MTTEMLEFDVREDEVPPLHVRVTGLPYGVRGKNGRSRTYTYSHTWESVTRLAAVYKRTR